MREGLKKSGLFLEIFHKGSEPHPPPPGIFARVVQKAGGDIEVLGQLLQPAPAHLVEAVEDLHGVHEAGDSGEELVHQGVLPEVVDEDGKVGGSMEAHDGAGATAYPRHYFFPRLPLTRG